MSFFRFDCSAIPYITQSGNVSAQVFRLKASRAYRDACRVYRGVNCRVPLHSVLK